MRKQLLVLVLCSSIISISSAQLVVNSGLTPLQLANAIAGQGVTVYNVTFTGDSTMAATFTAAATNLGIPSGVMLASGDVSYAIGPNISTMAGTDMNLAGDSILDTLAGIGTHDACILEFDFSPQSSYISFRYVFGSDEYPEFVCSQYNDVFAFLISGPGITGYKNMALIPATTTPVAINTVNSGVVGASGSPGPNCGLGNSSYYIDNTAGATIELDGFTIPMIAEANVLPCGTYHLRIMIADAGDGRYDSGVFIEQGSLSSNPSVNAGIDQTICTGNSAQLGGPPEPGYSYHWSPATGLSNAFISDPTATLINLGTTPIIQGYSITGNNGSCLFSDSVYVTVNPAPAPSFTITPPGTCAGQTMTINYNGNIAANYVWNFGSATVVSGSGSGPYVISYSSTITDTISVTASDTGCTGTFSLPVTVGGNPIADFILPPSACLGDTIQITFTGTAPAAAVYTWDFGNGQVISGSGSGPYSINWSNAGTPTVSLVINDNGCISLPDSSQILIAQSPVAIAGNDTSVCPSSNVLLGSAGQPGIVYQWSPTIGLSDPAIANPSALIPNTGNNTLINDYYVTATNPQGCSSTDRVSVTVIPAVSVDFAAPVSQCFKSNNFNFAVQGNYPAASVFSWNFGSAATPASSALAVPPSVTYSSTGIYTITLNASSGSCVMPPVSHTVEINPEPITDFVTNDLQACSPLKSKFANLSPDPANLYLWALSGGITSNDIEPIFNLTTPGQYDVTLTATTTKGCSTTITKVKYLTVFASPEANFIPQPRVASIESPLISFANNSEHAITYLWDFGDSTTSQAINPSHLYGATGEYEIMLIAMSNGGCIDTTYGTIEINEGLSFYIPNSFTPNGDGKNDFFQGFGINILTYQMWIYDRWGKMIFQTNDYDKPWDGKMTSPVQADTYIYKFLVTDKMHEQHDFVGSVTVVR